MTDSLDFDWRPRRAGGLVLLGTLLALVSAPARGAEPPVRFARDVQPLLADKCFACHGPDPATRKAKLRLDRPEDARADLGGYAALVPGKPDESEAYQRLIAPDDEGRMPPSKTGKPLSAHEIEVFRRWIAGAKWESHWSLVPPVRAPLPTIADASWPRNAVDRFVLARLEQEGLRPSPEAPRRVLIRRLSFDLTGLPPTPTEVEDFLNDTAPDAYERLVARLLASVHHGERLALDWLDAARYSDTDGYQSDETRTNWPWRDWVIDAYNRNLPFDQFTIEQCAGDLLPGASPEQKLATCFHRNHMTNGEGGRDPEESRVDYVIDRVNTLGTVWLGLTLGCTQCHSHKFDPITQSDYYSLTAFFNSIDEDGKAGRAAKPYLSYRSPHAARAVAEARSLLDERKARETAARAEAEPAFAHWLAQKQDEVRGGFTTWRTFHASSFETLVGSNLEQDAAGVVTVRGPDPRHEDYRVIGPVALSRVTGFRLDVLPDPAHTGGGLSRSSSGHFILTDIKVQVRRKHDGTQVREPVVEGAVADYSADPKKYGGYGNVLQTLDDDPRNGWATFGGDPKQPHSAVFALAEPLVLEPDENLIIELRQRSTQGRHNIGRFRLALTDQPGAVVRSLDLSPLEDLTASEPDSKLRARLFDLFLEDHAPYVEARRAVERATRHLAEMKKTADKVDVMVLAERAEPRPTHILLRGVWDRKGEKVGRDVPAAIAPWPTEAERSRLGLARWLVSRENPLTARVAVNRLWQMVLGAGLVRTPEDFGRQGEPPTHPELLDWLAVEFMESGWDVRHVLRLIVTSATYRQRSEVSETLRTRDPENRLLARGARYRLPSGMIRDAALRASGLLNPATGGPPVRPYQPPGVWEEIFMGRYRYEPSEGSEQYRRSLYAFWRRSSAPTFLFDSAQRRVCEVRTSRTNTPLQALALLNDLTYIESARALAELAVIAGPDEAGRLRMLTDRVLSRPPEARELPILTRELDRARTYYRAHPAEADRWLAHGQSRPAAGLDRLELAAYAVVAELILNLDEAITRE